MQTQFKDDDLYSYGADNDGVHYRLSAHKSARLLLFGEFTENQRESQVEVHCIWVDDSSKGRYQILKENSMSKLVPIEFITAKYSQARYFFDRLEYTQNELETKKSVSEKDELAFEIDSFLIRLVKSLIHDVMNSEHIVETIDNDLNHI